MNLLNIKTMKTTIFTIAFAAAVLLSGCTVQAKPSLVTSVPKNDGVEEIFKQFKSEKNVTYINLPKSLIKMGLKSSNDKTASALADQIDALQILAFENTDKKAKDNLYKRIGGLEVKGYEPMVKTNEDGEKVRILVKSNEKEIQSIVIFAMDKEDCSLIRIDGHINPSDLDAIVDLQTK